MSLRTHIANWPLAWKVPLLAAGLMIGVAAVISQFVLNRLESDQEINLRLLTNAYLDGLSAAVLPAAIRSDAWEAFDALDRARTHTPASMSNSPSSSFRTVTSLRRRIH